MPTILIKKSDTPGSVPGTANLTNLAGGAEVAVNTADRRMYSMNSSSAVVELGTNPSSLTCADGSFTLLKAASASITNLTATSLVLSNLSIASANVTTLTSASATITNLLATSLTVSGNTFLATSSGNVGIGTSSPAYKLDVSGSDGTLFRLARGSVSFGTFLGTTDAFVGTFSNNGLAFITNDTLKAYLDTSGNLGLGVTPSAWYTLSTVFQSNSYAFEGRSGTPDYSAYWTNTYLNAAGSAFIYRGNGAATAYLQSQGVHRWRVAPSGTAGNTITFTEVMTLDGSGNLGVGTTSPGYKLDVNNTNGSAATARLNGNDQANVRLRLENSGSGGRTWEIVGGLPGANNSNFSISDASVPATRLTIDTSGNLLVGTTTNGGVLTINGPSDAASRLRIYNQTTDLGALGSYAGFIGSGGANDLLLFGSTNMFVGSNGYVAFTSGGATERARITSGGEFWVGATSAGYTTSVLLLSLDNSTKWLVGPAAGYADRFYVTAASANGVYLSSTSATSWSSASDERFKTDLKPIENAISKVDSLRAVTGRFKTDEEGVSRAFLIAQDIMSVLPEAVDSSNPDLLGVQYTDVIPLLVAAIKELSAKVAALEAK